jgi:hypothetical protein
VSVTHDESRLRFVFGDGWKVVKWDDHVAFKKGLGQGSTTTKAVDFIGVLLGAPWFIEIKNFRKYRIENKERLASGALAKEIAGKVRDSIASITWACQRAPLDERELAPFVRAVFGWKERVSVVLWLEEEHAQSKGGASMLAELIKRELAWLNPKVLVMCRELAEKSPLQGITVTSLPDEPTPGISGSSS